MSLYEEHTQNTELSVLQHEGMRKETKKDGYDGYQPEVCCVRLLQVRR